MSKKEELAKLVLENPKHELIFMYPYSDSDYDLTMGTISWFELEEYYVADDRVWFKDEESELFEEWSENIFIERYSPLDDVPEHEIDLIDKEAQEMVDKIEWTPCIAVHIRP